MGDKTGIEWTDATWNPIVGCSVVSPGCSNCYAMAMADRIQRMTPRSHYAGTTQDSKAGPVWTGKLVLAPEHILTAPLRWRRPRRIFVNSMGDPFHESVPDSWIDQTFAVMALAHWHTFQVLTKRSARMRAYMSGIWNGRVRAERLGRAFDPDADCSGCGPNHNMIVEGARCWPFANIWLGVSAEDQRRADERVPDLLATPAAVRFVSAEPLLGPIDFKRWLQIDWQCSRCRGFFSGRHRPVCPSCGQVGGWTGSHAFNGRHQPKRAGWPIDRGSGLDWVIVGGESSPNARVWSGFEEAARSIKAQCLSAGAAFFMKQMAGVTKRAMPPIPADLLIRQMPARRLLDGVEHNGMPDVRAAAATDDGSADHPIDVMREEDALG